MDLATLEIRIQTVEAKQAAADLKSLETQAGSTSKATDSLSGSFRTLATAALAYVSTTAIIDFLKSSAVAFMEAEVASNKLSVALRNQGQYSEGTIASYKSFAAQLQEVTAAEDDMTLAIMANLKTYGMSNEQVERATKAALDLAAAKKDEGMSATTAGELLGKAYAGVTATLGRYGLIIEEGLSNSEKFNAALGLIEQRFGGAAQAELNTYAGNLKQIGNIWGDFKEIIGEVVMALAGNMMPTLRGVIDTLRESATYWLKAFGIGVTDDQLVSENLESKRQALLLQIEALKTIISLTEVDMGDGLQLSFSSIEETEKLALLEGQLKNVNKTIEDTEKYMTATGAATQNLGTKIEDTGKKAEVAATKIKELQDPLVLQAQAINQVTSAIWELTATDYEKSLVEIDNQIGLWLEGLEEVTPELEKQLLIYREIAMAKAGFVLPWYDEYVTDVLDKPKEVIPKVVEEINAATKESIDQLTVDMERSWDQMARNVQDIFGTVIGDMLKGELQDWEDYGKAIYDIMADTLAQIVSMYLQNEIVMPIVAQLTGGSGGGGGILSSLLGGGGSGGGGGSSILSTLMSLGSSASGGGGNILSSLGSLFGGGGAIAGGASGAAVGATGIGASAEAGAMMASSFAGAGSGGAAGGAGLAGAGMAAAYVAIPLAMAAIGAKIVYEMTRNKANDPRNIGFYVPDVGLTIGANAQATYDPNKIREKELEYWKSDNPGATTTTVPVQTGTTQGAQLNVGEMVWDDYQGWIPAQAKYEQIPTWSATGQMTGVAGANNTEYIPGTRLNTLFSTAPQQMIDNYIAELSNVFDEATMEAIKTGFEGVTIDTEGIYQTVVKNSEQDAGYEQLFDSFVTDLINNVNTSLNESVVRSLNAYQKVLTERAAVVELADLEKTGMFSSMDKLAAKLKVFSDAGDMEGMYKFLDGVELFLQSMEAYGDAIAQEKAQIDATAQEGFLGLIGTLSTFRTQADDIGIVTEKTNEAMQNYVVALIQGRDAMTPYERAIYTASAQLKRMEQALIYTGMSAEDAARITTDAMTKMVFDLNRTFMEWQMGMKGMSEFEIILDRYGWSIDKATELLAWASDTANTSAADFDKMAASLSDIDPSMTTEKLMRIFEVIKRGIADLAYSANQLAAATDQPNTTSVRVVKQYQAGGYHAGGLRIVGEAGPELEFTGASKIYNNSETVEMIAMAVRKALGQSVGSSDRFDATSVSTIANAVRRAMGITEGTTGDLSEAIRKLEDNFNSLSSALKNVQDMIDDLKFGDLAPVNSREKMEFKYQSLIDKMRSGTEEEKATASSELQNFVPDYLKFMNEFGMNYTEVADKTLSDLEGLDISIQTEISVMTLILETNQAMLATLQAQQGAGSGYTSGSVGGGGSNSSPSMWNTGGGSSIFNGGSVAPMNKVWGYLDQMMTIGGSDFGSSSATGNYSSFTNINPFTSDTKIKAYAGGGDFGGGFRMVGERGPEAEFTGPSRIMSSRDTTSMIADAVAQAIGGRSGGNNGEQFTFIVKIGNQEVKDIVVEVIPGAIHNDPSIQHEIKRVANKK